MATDADTREGEARRSYFQIAPCVQVKWEARRPQRSRAVRCGGGGLGKEGEMCKRLSESESMNGMEVGVACQRSARHLIIKHES